MNKKTLKPIKINKQRDNDQPNSLEGELPPLIFDPENSEFLKQKSEETTDLIEQFLKSNFFIGILVGGSMQ